MFEFGGAFDAGGIGQLNIHQDHVRPRLGDLPQRFRDRATGADALEAGGPVEQGLKSFAQGLVVLDDADFDAHSFWGSGA